MNDNSLNKQDGTSNCKPESSPAQAKSLSDTISSHQTNDNDKPLLVLVNPKSGFGQSVRICESKVRPFLESHNIKYEILITDHQRRISDHIRDLNLSELVKCKAILVVSGDGLVHEVVNGLMRRDDWQEAMKIPIGVIPTGSGNGLAYTLIRSKHPEITGRDEGIELCCQNILQSTTTRVDLIKVTFGDSHPKKAIWSFLSFGWGLLADIDVDSDWLRRLGDLRFTIYGIIRALTSKSLKAKLSFEVAKLDRESDTPTDCTGELHSASIDDDTDSGSSWTHIEDTFACVYAVYLSHISRTTNFSPESKLTDQIMYLTYVRGKLSPIKVIEFLLAIEDGSHVKLPYVHVVPVTRFEFQPLESSKIVVDGEVIPWTISDGSLAAEVIPGIMKLLWDPE